MVSERQRMHQNVPVSRSRDEMILAARGTTPRPASVATSSIGSRPRYFIWNRSDVGVEYRTCLLSRRRNEIRRDRSMRWRGNVTFPVDFENVLNSILDYQPVDIIAKIVARSAVGASSLPGPSDESKLYGSAIVRFSLLEHGDAERLKSRDVLEECIAKIMHRLVNRRAVLQRDWLRVIRIDLWVFQAHIFVKI